MQRAARKCGRIRRRYVAELNGTRCFTVDIGRDGFSVELFRVLKPGTAVHGTLDAGGVQIPFRGDVRWAQTGLPYRIRGRMGVRFGAE